MWPSRCLSRVGRFQNFFGVKRALGRVFVFEEQEDIFSRAEKSVGGCGNFFAVFRGVLGLAKAVLNKVGCNNFGGLQFFRFSRAEGDFMIGEQFVGRFG